MKKKIRSAFNTRQHMLYRNFEVFYYSDTKFHNIQSHSHDYYEFYFFIEGKVEMDVDGKLYPLRYGDMFLIPPGIQHCAVVDSSMAYRRFVLWVSRKYFSHLAEQSSDYVYLLKQTTDFQKYLYRFDVLTANTVRGNLFSLLDEIHSNRFGRETKISLSFSSLILLLNRIAFESDHPKTDKEDRSLYEGVINFIDMHLDEELSLNRLANELFVSKYTISHLFQHNTGLSVHQYILKKRLKAFCEAICSGTSITNACRMCGFHDYSSLYRAFRKEFGQSPTQYLDICQSGADASKSDVQ